MPFVLDITGVPHLPKGNALLDRAPIYRGQIHSTIGSGKFPKATQVIDSSRPTGTPVMTQWHSGTAPKMPRCTTEVSPAAFAPIFGKHDALQPKLMLAMGRPRTSLRAELRALTKRDFETFVLAR